MIPLYQPSSTWQVERLELVSWRKETFQETMDYSGLIPSFEALRTWLTKLSYSTNKSDMLTASSMNMRADDFERSSRQTVIFPDVAE
jgi:hypothetical protein